MPKPPALPTIDWKAVFASGLPWSDWLEVGESPENRRRMADDVETLSLEPQDIAWLAAL